MLPSKIVSNVEYGAHCYPEQFCYFAAGYCFMKAQFSNRWDVNFFEFRRLAIFAATCGIAITALGHHVFYVVSLSPDKEMVWVAALWIVTVVAHYLVFRYFSLDNFPCKSMSLVSLLHKVGLSIPKNVSGALPIPAFVWMGEGYIGPKIALLRTIDRTAPRGNERRGTTAAVLDKRFSFHECIINELSYYVNQKRRAV